VLVSDRNRGQHAFLDARELPDILAGLWAEAADLAIGSLGAFGERAVPYRDVDASVRERRRCPHRGAERPPPQERAISGGEANEALEAIAGADVDPAADHQWAAIDVGALVLPVDLPGERIGAVEAVVAGAEVKLPFGHSGRRFGVAPGLDRPDFPAAGQIQAVELAVRVVVEPLADVDSAIPDGRRREDGPAGVELPARAARGEIQAVDPVAIAADYDALASHCR